MIDPLTPSLLLLLLVAMFWSSIWFLTLLSSPLLAYPVSPNPHHPTNVLNTIDCFQQRYSPSYPISAFFPIAASDCTRAAQILLCGDGLTTVHFSRRPAQGTGLPFSWHHRTCEVKIDIPAEGNPVETTTLLEISAMVLRITQRCILSRGSRHLGGRSTVGRNNLIEVTVSGLAYEMGADKLFGQCVHQFST